ncbi:unnamed protein product [Cuscuta epithymum]|uniref:Uncharacterized protein n=1 Tax=Cuscuta epithymum TaxID=186058 RepID=A0AAV0GCW7_9ASTE|nr:unnamed protein product [Cuscuta epithymum]
MTNAPVSIEKPGSNCASVNELTTTVTNAPISVDKPGSNCAPVNDLTRITCDPVKEVIVPKYVAVDAKNMGLGPIQVVIDHNEAPVDATQSASVQRELAFYYDETPVATHHEAVTEGIHQLVTYEAGYDTFEARNGNDGILSDPTQDYAVTTLIPIQSSDETISDDTQMLTFYDAVMQVIPKIVQLRRKTLKDLRKSKVEKQKHNLQNLSKRSHRRCSTILPGRILISSHDHPKPLKKTSKRNRLLSLPSGREV